MEGKMRVTVIATGFEEHKSLQHKPHLLPIENTLKEEVLKDGTTGQPAFTHLKNLASSIKEENPEFEELSMDYDIPTFLRKHAD